MECKKKGYLKIHVAVDSRKRELSHLMSQMKRYMMIAAA